MTVSRYTARRLAAGSALLLIGLGVNVALSVERPVFVLLVLAGAGGGLCAVVVSVMGVSGYSAVHHAKSEARAIERVYGRQAIQASRKELIR